ncbi:MAG: hypothetical protein V1742_07560 [Pseudomonadota bacterium]
MKLANLKPEELEEIKALEAKLGGVCLVAVEKAEALYAVEAKLAPDHWAPVDQVYPEIENLKSYFASGDDAAAAKGALKSLLAGKRNFKAGKRPIRVKRI